VNATPADGAEGYDGAAVLGAVLATIFFPLIALIAALLLMGGQPNPYKRRQLRTWAWLSGGLIALQVLLVVLALGAWTSQSGGVHPVP
jgi:heme A synthase